MNKHNSNEEGMETSGFHQFVGSNPTPCTTAEPPVFWHAHLSLDQPYFGFLKSFALLISHTNSKRVSIGTLTCCFS